MMSRIDAGSLPVGQDDRLVGMLTDRDIVIRAVANSRGPDTKVEEIMSTGICYCYEDEEADDVCRNLADQQIRRIPVVDRDKQLVGILSLGDLARVDGGGAAGMALAGITAHSAARANATRIEEWLALIVAFSAMNNEHLGWETDGARPA